MSNTLDLIKAKRTERSELITRQDADLAIVTLYPYVLQGISEQMKDKPLPGSISVTLNKAAVYFDSYYSTLSTLTRQIVVEGLSDTANHDVEEFAEDLLYTLNQSLVRRRMGSLGLSLAQLVCLRGDIGIELTWDGAQKKFVPYPLDMRWCTYQEAGEVLEWYSNYTRRDAAALVAEYKDVKGFKPGLVPDNGKDLEVDNWWSGDKNELWVGSDLVLEQDNTYGEPPAVIVTPQTGVYVQDKGYIKYRGESIFNLSRTLVDEINRLASILQTKGIQLIDPPYTQEKQAQGGVLKADPLPHTGSSEAYLPGEVPKPFITPDLTQAFIVAMQSLEKHWQQGAISDAELGDTNLDRPGVWFTQMHSIREKRQAPRIDAISQMYEELIKLAMREIRTFKATQKLGKKHKAWADVPDPDEVTINCRLMAEDKVLDVVRRAEAVSMRGILPMYDILKDILHHEDPDGVLNRMALEKAEANNPIVYYRETSRRLRVLAKSKTGQEKKDLIADALMFADLMEQAIEGQGQPQAQVSEQPKGQGQAIQGIAGMMKPGGGNGQMKQIAAPKAGGY